MASGVTVVDIEDFNRNIDNINMSELEESEKDGLSVWFEVTAEYRTVKI
jgi:hypothetical protein